MTGPARFSSHAVIWQELATDLLFAIDQLEAANRNAPIAVMGRDILFAVAEDLQSVQLQWCNSDGQPLAGVDQGVCLDIQQLPDVTDTLRTEVQFAPTVIPPNASIDRAISKAAGAMVSWTEDAETCELLTHQRYRLFLRWPYKAPEPVYEYAYGLWDE